MYFKYWQPNLKNIFRSFLGLNVIAVVMISVGYGSVLNRVIAGIGDLAVLLQQIETGREMSSCFST